MSGAPSDLLHEAVSKWCAHCGRRQIWDGTRVVSAGFFDNEAAAAAAYDAAALRLRGDRAVLNFPDAAAASAAATDAAAKAPTGASAPAASANGARVASAPAAQEESAVTRECGGLLEQDSAFPQRMPAASAPAAPESGAGQWEAEGRPSQESAYADGVLAASAPAARERAAGYREGGTRLEQEGLGGAKQQDPREADWGAMQRRNLGDANVEVPGVPDAPRRSAFRGVSWDRKHGTWRAQVHLKQWWIAAGL